MQDARVIGVLTGSAAEPRLAYLKRGTEITPSIAAELGNIDPTHVFRYAARCEEGRCGQFKDGRCGLGERIAAMLAPVVDALPSCQIRRHCRWHEEQGAPACLRCPQVTTRVGPEQATLHEVASPPS
jgi:hypothetical protein